MKLSSLSESSIFEVDARKYRQRRMLSRALRSREEKGIAPQGTETKTPETKEQKPGRQLPEELSQLDPNEIAKIANAQTETRRGTISKPEQFERLKRIMQQVAGQIHKLYIEDPPEGFGKFWADKVVSPFLRDMDKFNINTSAWVATARRGKIINH